MLIKQLTYQKEDIQQYCTHLLFLKHLYFLWYSEIRVLKNNVHILYYWCTRIYSDVKENSIPIYFMCNRKIKDSLFIISSMENPIFIDIFTGYKWMLFEGMRCVQLLTSSTSRRPSSVRSESAWSTSFSRKGIVLCREMKLKHYNIWCTCCICPIMQYCHL